jgi:hypothetical protein
MIVAIPEPQSYQQHQPVSEQRVMLRDVTWAGYLQILAALPPSHGSRLTYDVMSIFI